MVTHKSLTAVRPMQRSSDAGPLMWQPALMWRQGPSSRKRWPERKHFEFRSRGFLLPCITSVLRFDTATASQSVLTGELRQPLPEGAALASP